MLFSMYFLNLHQLDYNITCAILQGITEVIPVASGLHLQIMGMYDIYTLHLVTGFTGLIYALFYQRKAIQVTLKSMFSPAFILQAILTFILVKSNLLDYLKITAIYPILLLILAIIIILFELSVLRESSNRSIESFNPTDLGWSITANLIGIIPGASRLGSVYLFLRIRGYTPKNAILLGTIQGMFISTIFIIPYFKYISTLLSIPNLICGLIYVGLTYLVLSLNNKMVRNLILFCCGYRIFLAFYLASIKFILQ